MMRKRQNWNIQQMRKYDTMETASQDAIDPGELGHESINARYAFGNDLICSFICDPLSNCALQIDDRLSVKPDIRAEYLDAMTLSHEMSSELREFTHYSARNWLHPGSRSGRGHSRPLARCRQRDWKHCGYDFGRYSRTTGKDRKRYLPSPLHHRTFPLYPVSAAMTSNHEREK